MRPGPSTAGELGRHVLWRRVCHTRRGPRAPSVHSGPTSPPPLTQALPRVTARAKHAGPSRERVTPEDERHRMVGRQLAGSHRVRLAMPSRAGPAVDCHPVLDRPRRQASPGRRPPHRVVWRPAEAVSETRAATAVAASLVRRGPAAGTGVVFAAPTGADPCACHLPSGSLEQRRHVASPGPLRSQPGGGSGHGVLPLQLGQEKLGDDIGVELVGEAAPAVLPDEVRGEPVGPGQERMRRNRYRLDVQPRPLSLRRAVACAAPRPGSLTLPFPVCRMRRPPPSPVVGRGRPTHRPPVPRAAWPGPSSRRKCGSRRGHCSVHLASR